MSGSVIGLLRPTALRFQVKGERCAHFPIDCFDSRTFVAQLIYQLLLLPNASSEFDYNSGQSVALNGGAYRKFK